MKNPSLQKKKLLHLLLISLILTVSCSKVKEEQGNLLITGFEIEGMVGDETIDNNSTPPTITIIMPDNADLQSLSASKITLSNENATVSPAVGEQKDFSINPVEYKVELGNNSTTYSVKVVEEGMNTAIDKFVLAGVTGTISNSEGRNIIEVLMLKGTDLTSLAATEIVLANENATIYPGVGDVHDFDNNKEVTYTVTAEDESTKDYEVYVKVASDKAEITNFMFKQIDNNTLDKDYSATPDKDNIISITIPFGINRDGLIPRIEYSAGASISPASNIAQNFYNKIEYEVTAADKNKKETFSVEVDNGLPSQDAKITEFVFPAGEGNDLISDIGGKIYHDSNEIILDVLMGINIDELGEPNIEMSEHASVTNNGKSFFSGNRIYTVTAQDENISVDYSIKVTTIKPSLTVNSYSEDSKSKHRIGVGDYAKTKDLFKVSNVNNNVTYAYALKVKDINDNYIELGAGHIVVNSQDGEYLSSSEITPEKWRSDIPSENISFELFLSFDNGSISETFEYIRHVMHEPGNIRSWQDLYMMRNDLSKDYNLKNDISLPQPTGSGAFPAGLPSEGFTPIGEYIGDNASNSSSTPNDSDTFEGKFDGEGNTIYNLNISLSSSDHVGLFGCLGSGGEITDLNVEVGKIYGKSYVGGLVGVSYNGGISKCNIIAKDNESEIKSETFAASSIGGLVGLCKKGTAIEDSRNSGVSVEGDRASGVGGLVGSSVASIDLSVQVIGSYSTGKVKAHNAVGGLIGETVSTINVERSYASGEVACLGNYAGGLIGEINGSGYITARIKNCYASGSVTGETTSFSIGGLIGAVNVNVVDHGSFLLQHCYAVGRVSGTAVNQSGGMVGYLNSTSSKTTVKKCYWDKNTTGQDSYFGSVNDVPNSEHDIHGKNTAEMQSGQTYSNWNFLTIWGIYYNYPYLR